MDRKQKVRVARSLVRLAKELNAQDRIRRREQGMNALVTKLIDFTDGDLRKMLTAVIMAGQKAGKIPAGSTMKLINKLQQALKVV